MSRTNKFLQGFGVGYLNLAVTTLVGLYLTRFYLSHLGQAEYGYWLIASQLLGLAALLDLGVVSLLPREVAYVTGARTDTEAGHQLSALLERVSGLVLLQTPLVSGLLFVGWLLLPPTWEPLRWPLALLLLGFSLSFPLRIPTAALTGLQDLGFLSSVQLVAWCFGTGLTVLLVILGWRLEALAVGYIATQAVVSGSAVLRLRRICPGWRGTRLVLPGRASLGYLRSAGWATASQLAQLFVLGTEGVIVGSLFGAAVVVPYSMTGRLFAVLGNQPNLVMQAAAPGLSEARASTDGPTRLQISVALAQGMLTLTAIITIVILAVNQGFVTWWLGATQYAGLALTSLFALRLFFRHWNTTLVYTLFSFGHEKRIALIGLSDGVLTLVLSLTLGKFFGLIGVPLGSILGVLLTSLPLNIAAIRVDTGVPVLRIAGAQIWWQWRALVLAILAATGSLYGNQARLLPLVAKGALALVASVVVLVPLMLRPPLGPYITPRIRPALRRLGLSPEGPL